VTAPTNSSPVPKETGGYTGILDGAIRHLFLPVNQFVAGSTYHERIRTLNGTCSQCEALEVFQRTLKKDEKLSIAR
jgi:hypothetical protein